MAENAVKSCIYARRSVRRFTQRRVERPLLEELIMAGCMAPTGSNLQTWRFVAVDDPALIKAVCAVSPGISGTPPCILTLCTDERLALAKGGTLALTQLAVMDLSMAAQNIMLLATEYGLGACAVKSFQPALVHRVLGLPEHIAVHLMLTLGYPAKIPENAPKRRPLTEILRYNEWEE
jgi:nitroreductase